jgi:hypothetical protein
LHFGIAIGIGIEIGTSIERASFLLDPDPHSESDFQEPNIQHHWNKNINPFLIVNKRVESKPFSAGQGSFPPSTIHLVFTHTGHRGNQPEAGAQRKEMSLARSRTRSRRRAHRVQREGEKLSADKPSSRTQCLKFVPSSCPEVELTYDCDNEWLP